MLFVKSISIFFDSLLFNVIRHVYMFDKFTKELKTTQKGNNSRRCLFTIVYEQSFGIKKTTSSHRKWYTFALGV